MQEEDGGGGGGGTGLGGVRGGRRPREAGRGRARRRWAAGGDGDNGEDRALRMGFG